MSNLLKGLSSADADPAAGYEPSYRYFNQEEDEAEQPGHWTVTGQHSPKHHCVDETDNAIAESSADDDLIIVEQDSYRLCSDSSRTTRKNVLGNIHRNPGNYDSTSSSFKIPKKQPDSEVDSGNEDRQTKRSSSPVFPIVPPLGGGDGLKRKVRSTRAPQKGWLIEKSFKGNATGCHMKGIRSASRGGGVIRGPGDRAKTATFSPQKYLTVYLDKCDSPTKGRITLPSSHRKYSPCPSTSTCNHNTKTNGGLWKYSAPSPPAARQNHSDKIHTVEIPDDDCSPVNQDTRKDVAYREQEISLNQKDITRKERLVSKQTDVTSKVGDGPAEIEVSGKTECADITSKMEDVAVKDSEEEMETYAVCAHCGSTSHNLQKCDYSQCGKPIDPSRIRKRKKRKPVDKTEASTSQGTLTGVITKNFYGKALADISSSYRSDNESPTFPVKPIKTIKTYPGKRSLPQQRNYRGQRSVRAVSTRGRRKLAVPSEPVCVTISSDEEEEEEEEEEKGEERDNAADESPVESRIADSSQESAAETPNNIDSSSEQSDVNLNATGDESIHDSDVSSSTSQSLMPRKMKMRDQDGNAPQVSDVSSTVKKRPTERKNSPEFLSAIIDMRGIRIGTLKVESIMCPVVFTQNYVEMKIAVDEEMVVDLKIDAKHITKVEIFDGRPASLINLFTTPGAGLTLRNKLKMKKTTGWFDPGSMIDAEKRIILIAKTEPLDQFAVRMINRIFMYIAASNEISGMIVKLNQDKANDILVANTTANPKKGDSLLYKRSVVPRGRVQPRRAASQVVMETVELDEPTRLFSGPVVKLCSYPPPPSTGAITITNEDLFCLNEEEFLNDVIIDFYLKYLADNVLHTEDKKRTHIFSSFFYKRLSQRPQRVHQEDSQKPLEHRRHKQVKTWTRHVDLFEKDFIIVPINECAHWYLAIICFPGMAVGSADQANDKENANGDDSTSENGGDGQCSTGEGKTEGVSRKKVDNESTTSDRKTDKEELVSDGVEEESNSNPGYKDLSDGNDESSDSVSSHGNMKNGAGDEVSKLDKDEANDRGDDDGRFDLTSSSDDEGRPPIKIARVESLSEGMMEDGSSEDSDESAIKKNEMSSDAVEEKTEDESAESGKEGPSQVKFKQPCILLFDSLLGPIHNNVIKTLKEYLAVEYESRKGKEKKFMKECIRGSSVKVPQQSNYSDCGVFLLHYVEMFFKKPPGCFSLPIQTLKKWFPEDDIPHKREYLIKLITTLQEEQSKQKKS